MSTNPALETRRKFAEQSLRLIQQHLGPESGVRIDPARHSGQFAPCRASLSAATIVYPASTAPVLPLKNCDNPERCTCTYSVRLET